jgi:hypothetical protein
MACLDFSWIAFGLTINVQLLEHFFLFIDGVRKERKLQDS